MKPIAQTGKDQLLPILKRASVRPLHDAALTSESDVVRLASWLRLTLRKGKPLRVLVFEQS